MKSGKCTDLSTSCNVQNTNNFTHFQKLYIQYLLKLQVLVKIPYSSNSYSVHLMHLYNILHSCANVCDPLTKQQLVYNFVFCCFGFPGFFSDRLIKEDQGDEREDDFLCDVGASGDTGEVGTGDCGGAGATSKDTDLWKAFLGTS